MHAACPSNLTLNTDTNICGAIVAYSPTQAVDNCNVAEISLVSVAWPSGALFPLGVTPVMYSVNDTAGNEVACVFNVTIKDAQLPSLGKPSVADICSPTLFLYNC